MPRWRNKTIWNTALLSAVFLVISDRFLKVYSEKIWKYNHLHVFPGLELTFFKNKFIAFSLDTIINPIFIIIPVFIFLLVYFIKKLKSKNLKEATILLFIIVGAASNLYDRVVYGYIIDYISLQYFTVFNLADVMISGGIIYYIFFIKDLSIDKRKNLS